MFLKIGVPSHLVSPSKMTNLGCLFSPIIWNNRCFYKNMCIRVVQRHTISFSMVINQRINESMKLKKSLKTDEDGTAGMPALCILSNTCPLSFYFFILFHIDANLRPSCIDCRLLRPARLRVDSESLHPKRWRSPLVGPRELYEKAGTSWKGFSEAPSRQSQNW